MPCQRPRPCATAAAAVLLAAFLCSTRTGTTTTTDSAVSRTRKQQDAIAGKEVQVVHNDNNNNNNHNNHSWEDLQQQASAFLGRDAMVRNDEGTDNDDEASSSSSYEGPHGGFVLLKYKLVFFPIPKVGSTTWKMLFRRLLGFADWNVQNNAVPHRPSKNGLVTLQDFSAEQVAHFLTAPDWTRAIFVRDPMERFLSAYLDKGRKSLYLRRTCCSKAEAARQAQLHHNNGSLSFCCSVSSPPRCFREVTRSPEDFFQTVVTHCANEHWRWQSRRLRGHNNGTDWSHALNFVGRAERVAEDSERLFRRLGLWESPMIQTGWGDSGAERIFSPAATVGRQHRQDADRQSDTLLTAALHARLLEYYRSDYEHPVFNFTPPTLS